MHVTLSFRPLTERQIVKVTRTRAQDVAVQRAAKRRTRAYLELLRRGGGIAPVAWLDDAHGLVSLVIWPRAAQAQAQVTTARRFAPRGVALPIVAARNVAVITSGDAPTSAKTRVRRAIVRMRTWTD